MTQNDNTNNAQHVHQKDSDKYVVLGTKTSPEFAERFHKLCHRKGIKSYQALQMMVDAFVRYTDDRHNLSQEMEQLMMIFEHMNGWRDAFNLADATPDRHIDEAIYMLTAEDRKGARAIMVHRPYFGKWNETTNIQAILERVIEVLMPELYRRLRALAVEMDCKSLLELLDVMIDAHTVEAINEQYRQGFQDNNRHDYGRPVEYGQRTRRKHHKTVDTFERQTSIVFTDDDRRQAADEVGDIERDGQWLEDSMEFRPHGGEW